MCGGRWRICSRPGGRGSPGVPGVLLLAVVGAWVVACENPQPPLSCGAIPRQAVFSGETITVEACFDDPNGEVLAYAAATSDSGVAVAGISGSTVTIDGVAPGIAFVTVTATDPGGLEADERFPVAVPNRAPEAVGVIPGLELEVGDSAVAEVSDYFSDPDGQGLSYMAAVSNTGIATVTAKGSVLTVGASAKGLATVTVTATDPGGLEAVQSFSVIVPNRAPEAVGAMPAQTVAVGETVMRELVSYFRDPDGDALAYAAMSSDSRVARASVEDGAVAVAALARGETSVTVTATDPEGLAASQTFPVNVPNRAPLAIGSVPADTVAVGAAATLDPYTYFRDPDGDSLVFAATASDPAVLEVSVSPGAVTVAAIAEGDVTVTVTATDIEGLAATQTFTVTVPARPEPVELEYELVRTLPHDPEAYTQGLLIHDGLFFESTGRYGKSELRQVEIVTGRVLLSDSLPEHRFGEGLARVGDMLIQLTWKSGVAFVYEAATLEPLDTFEYEGEGWGLCHDGESLYMSNGSDTLQRRNPGTFELIERIGVTRNEAPVHRLNELECVGNHVYANIYRSDEIVRIDKVTGSITGELDGSSLTLASGRPAHPGAVLNGIAHDTRTGSFFVTGKLWPVIFEIEITEK